MPGGEYSNPELSAYFRGGLFVDIIMVATMRAAGPTGTGAAPMSACGANRMSLNDRFWRFSEVADDVGEVCLW
jgi:hypothetical protein